MDIVDAIRQGFPHDLVRNPFEHIISTCHEFYKADYCSFVSPNHKRGKWDINTRQPEEQHADVSLKIEKRWENRKHRFKDNPEAIWKNIEAGICNVALCEKRYVFVDDVNDTIYKYVRQFEPARHEIAIPLICDVPLTWKDESPENVIACIVLDYIDKDRYEDATKRVAGRPGIEKALGGLVYEYIYSKCLTSWNPVIAGVTTLAEIDFDTETSIERLNQNLSKLWPPLKYYSVWVANQRCPIDAPEKTFVRIGAIFIDDHLKASYLKIDEKLEYVLRQTDKNTYGKLLRDYSEGFRDVDFIYPRHVYQREEYVPMTRAFSDLLYGPDKKLEFHFIPIIENCGENELTIRGLIVFVFQFPGDSRLIKEEKLSFLARFIFDRVNVNMYKKTARLRIDIEKKSEKMFHDFDAFIEIIEDRLLKHIPSDAVDIWMLKRGEKSYFKLNKEDKWIVREVDREQKDYALNICLSDRKVRESHRHHPDYRNLCKNCPIKKQYDENKWFNWQSCMVAKITGLQGTSRAILFLLNRRNPSLEDRIQAFSFIDRKTVRDIVILLGAFFSLHEISGAEKTLRTILPHEFAAPIASLSHKLKDIEKFSARLIATPPSKLRNEDIKRLEKKFFDAWISCEAIAQNQKNYIKFSKGMVKVRPGEFKLYNLVEQIMHLFLEKFNQKKQIYIFVEGFDKNQFVSCNQSMLFSTIHNIFDNAAKYSHRYTVFHVRQRREEGKKNNISIVFKNYGIGIDDDELEKVFDLHYQSLKRQCYQIPPANQSLHRTRKPPLALRFAGRL